MKFIEDRLECKGFPNWGLGWAKYTQLQRQREGRTLKYGTWAGWGQKPHFDVQKYCSRRFIIQDYTNGDNEVVIEGSAVCPPRGQTFISLLSAATHMDQLCSQKSKPCHNILHNCLPEGRIKFPQTFLITLLPHHIEPIRGNGVKRVRGQGLPFLEATAGRCGAEALCGLKCHCLLGRAQPSIFLKPYLAHSCTNTFSLWVPCVSGFRGFSAPPM